MKEYYEAMRLGRWPRSLAIFVGCSAFFFLNQDHFAQYSILELLFRSFAAFLLTWGISTANYIINEIVDAPFDIHHPTKKNRPVVKGQIKRKPFLLIGTALALVSLTTAFILSSKPFFFSLLALLIAGFIYNIKPFRTKDIPFLDSISESANNPIRFFIGWYTFAPISLFPPISLLLCWWSFGNFLMVAKRLSEFRFLKDKAAEYRTSMKKYSKSSLLFGMLVSAVLFFVTYYIFACSFKLQSYIYLSPLILVFFLLILKKTISENEVMEEPERLLKFSFFSVYTLFMLVVYIIFSFKETIGY
ncbi:MAG: UbiA family prenyltransferase [Candidatus Aminicenantes bacterium]|nr:UbiA family prenyltransferase [Candidatus Aminicenantes bacterium]